MIECMSTAYARKYGKKLQNEHWYEHVTKLVEMIHECSIIDSTVQKERTVPKNKPVIVIRGNEERIHVIRRCSFGRQKCDEERS